MKAPENTRNWLKMLALYQAIGLLIVLVFRTYSEDPRPFFPSLVASLLFTNCISLLIEGLYYFKPQLKYDIYTPITFAVFRRHVLIVYFGMFVGSEVAMVLIDKILDIRYFPFISLPHLMLQVMNLVVSVVIVVIMAAFYQLRGRLAIKDQEYRQLENLQTRTQLAVLQARINPHFLFNTLSTILDLIYKSPQKAETVVLNLSDIYREVLTRSGNERITLEKELDLVRKYLEIEKIRMDERLNYTIECPEMFRSFQVPPLLLEPIVENAVIHGIAPRKEGGRVTIRVEKKGENCSIVVEDTGQGMGTKTGDIPGGFGIFSVRERLKLIYGEKAVFEAGPGPEGGTRVVMEVPYEHRHRNS